MAKLICLQAIKDLWQFANYGMRSLAWVDGDKFQMDDYIRNSLILPRL